MRLGFDESLLKVEEQNEITLVLASINMDLVVQL
jgi:hypothetical protein